MSNASNLYAEKVFAEHPLGLWALDDKLDYISLISEAQRNISSAWDVENGGIEATLTPPSGVPFPDSTTTTVFSQVFLTDTNDVNFWSPDLINFTSLDQDKGSFCVGSYVYCDSAYMNSISIGYEYTDPNTLEVTRNYKTFQTSVTQTWLFISETFEIPNVNAQLRAFLSINVSSGGSTTEAYRFYVNGVTVGQWSEEFNAKSLGVSYETIPLGISTYGGHNGVKASAYGLEDNPGYYIAYPNLLARNTSIPMVFGASNLTKLSPSNTASLIVPGKGFLNKKGQFLDYTIEFWAKINSDSGTDKKIFGPISSTDGLYVNQGFLTFAVGDNFGSHFVGEWFRPMLIHIRIIKDSVSVLLNGEQVIAFSINTDTLELPNELDQDGNNQDWLGFYSYEDVFPYEIDCVAIYPYSVPLNIAKRRWVYGQAVISTESINSSYNGSSAFIDYPFANYTSNYTYPNFANWNQGSFDNLNTTATSLSTPLYRLPEIFTGSKTLQNFYDDNQAIQSGANKFITFKPNSTWEGVQSYINFPSLNILNDEVHTIYGIFSSDSLLLEETLFKIYNTSTGNFFAVRKDLDEIHYYLNYNGQEEEIYRSSVVQEEELFVAGINIDRLVSSFGGNVATFFGSKNNLRLYVAGEEDNQYSFNGKMYSFGLSTSFNTSTISNHFSENGIALLDSTEELLGHTASYTLLPLEEYGLFYLDIGISGYWEDYLPLSYFGKYVSGKTGNYYYDLDFLQFNIDYPAPVSVIEHITEPYITYNTENASVKTYITFQYITDGANSLQENFTTTIPVSESNIIDIDLYPNWTTTKFEVIDGTLIYPSKLIDFNSLAIVYHVEFDCKGIIKKPVQIKKLELASQALNDNSFNPIGTRFGINLFPYKKSGIYYDYKSKNPFSIYKGTSPYLYLTRDSGIKVRGEFDPQTSRGIAISINESKSSSYQINAIQLWMKYDKSMFPENELELFDIKYKNDTIKFYYVSDTLKRNRAKIIAKSLNTGQEFNGLSYYQNGILVREPRISLNEWLSLGISFSNSLSFNSYIGSIDLNGEMLFNNISYYQANSLQQLQKYITRPWISVKNDGLVDLDWQYWLNDYVWQGVLVVASTNLYSTNPDEIYKTYIGTNKIIVDDSQGISFDPEKVSIYSERSWQTTIKTPV
jgi:hypothetical protein